MRGEPFSYERLFLKAAGPFPKCFILHSGPYPKTLGLHPWGPTPLGLTPWVYTLGSLPLGPIPWVLSPGSLPLGPYPWVFTPGSLPLAYPTPRPIPHPGLSYTLPGGNARRGSGAALPCFKNWFLMMESALRVCRASPAPIPD